VTLRVIQGYFVVNRHWMRVSQVETVLADCLWSESSCKMRHQSPLPQIYKEPVVHHSPYNK